MAASPLQATDRTPKCNQVKSPHIRAGVGQDICVVFRSEVDLSMKQDRV